MWLKKFAFWLIALGISFGIGALGIMNQGLAFIILYILVQIMLALEEEGVKSCTKQYSLSTNILVVLAAVVVHFGLLFVLTFITTKVFGIDFYIAFQILTLGKSINNYNPTQNENQ